MRTILAASLLVASVTATAQPPRTIALKGAAGGDAGTATLTPAPKGVLLHVEASGLTPGWHGIHFHSVGDCSDAAAGFKKSGGHVHAGAAAPVHGLLNPQATDKGDLTNIWAGADGRAHAEIFSAPATIDALADADGSAIVIHANPDDYATQPIGGAGERVACGVIKGA